VLVLDLPRALIARKAQLQLLHRKTQLAAQVSGGLLAADVGEIAAAQLQASGHRL
jgi:hypothetical protein